MERLKIELRAACVEIADLIWIVVYLSPVLALFWIVLMILQALGISTDMTHNPYH